MESTELMKGRNMDTMRVENKYQAPKIILMLVMVIILFLPANGLSMHVKSMKVIKTGTPVLKKDFGKAMSNAMLGNLLGGALQENPYDVARPVIVRVEYACDKTPNRLSSEDLETYQVKDKWGDWVANTNELKDVLYKRCGEETPSQKQDRLARAHREAKEGEEKAKAEEIKRADKIRFKVYDNGTVLDTKTNLMWAVKAEQPALEGTYMSHEWDRAKVACDRYRGGGYTDWRMPTIDELNTLYENNKRGYHRYHITDLMKIGYSRYWASDRRGDKAALFCYNDDFDKVEWVQSCPHNGCWALPVRSATRKGHEQGDIKTEIVTLNEAIELDPKNMTDYNERGNAYCKLGKYNEAIDDFNKAIELNPKYADAYLRRGVAYAALGKYNEAIDDFNKAIALNPKYEDAYYLRGLTYKDHGKHDEVIADFSKAIALNPKIPDYYFNRGLSYVYLKQNNEAIADLSKAIALNPKYADAYLVRGFTYNVLGKFNNAVDDFSKGIELNPKNPGYYINRGLSYAQLKQNNEALHDYNKAIEFEPQNADAYYGKSCLLSLMGNNLEACKYLKYSIEKGFKKWDHIKSDSDLNNIRNSECYREIMTGK